MANRHTTLTSLFDDIADAIREKTGSSEEIKADDFDTAIAAIPSGGGGPVTPFWWVQRFPAKNVLTAPDGSIQQGYARGATFTALGGTSSSNKWGFFYLNGKTAASVAVGQSMEMYFSNTSLNGKYYARSSWAQSSTSSTPTYAQVLEQVYFTNHWRGYTLTKTSATAEYGQASGSYVIVLFNRSGIIKYKYSSIDAFIAAVNSESISEDEMLAVANLYSSAGSASQSSTKGYTTTVNVRD